MQEIPDIKSIENTPFFFIIGRARSGTTLLRTLFDAHPEVAIPVESPVILRLYQKYRKTKKWDKHKLEDFYNDLLKCRYFDGWYVDLDRLKRDILNCSSDITFQTLIKLIYFHYPSIFKKGQIKILGDKNPVYSVELKSIFHIFPDAKYIILTRDYRDHILSMQRTKLMLPDVLFLAYRWRHSIAQAIKLKKKHPLKFYWIRYEDFVINPEFHLKNICVFLGLDYHQEVFSYPEKKAELEAMFPQETIEIFFKELFRPVNSDHIEVWKKEMKEKDIKIADAVVGKYAKLSGYDKKYRKKDFSTFIKIAPGFIFQKIAYFTRKIYWKVPVKIRLIIKKTMPCISKIFPDKTS